MISQRIKQQYKINEQIMELATGAFDKRQTQPENDYAAIMAIMDAKKCSFDEAAQMLAVAREAEVSHD